VGNIQEYGRATRQERYEGASAYTGLKAPFFNAPALSRAGIQRINKAMNNAQPLALKDSGDAVKAVQKALLALDDPYIGIPDGATGFFGKQTDYAVRTFQRRYQLERRDGLVGNETLGRLDSEYFNKTKKPDSANVKVWAPRWAIMPRLRQPWGPGTCWATAAAMLYYWKDMGAWTYAPAGEEEKIRYVVRQSKFKTERYVELFNKNQQLPFEENYNFYVNGFGMLWAGKSPYDDYSLTFWTEKLKRSPVLISGGRVNNNKFQGHAFVLVGVERTNPNPPVFYAINPETRLLETLQQDQFLSWLGYLPDYKDPDDFWRFLRKTTFSDYSQFRERVFLW
jgi:hypothetical protein